MKANNKQVKMPVSAKPVSNNKKKVSSSKGIVDSSKFRLWPILLGLISLIAIFVILFTYENEYFYRVQELNLFLYTPLFFKQCMMVSGGMLTYLGCFFIQFFYHQWMGVALLCAWWALFVWIIKHTFKISDKSSVVLLYPVIFLLLTDVDLGYWIFYLKMRGHFFASTIGFSAAVAAVWVYRCLSSKYYLNTLWMVLSVFILYPLIGFYSLLSVFLMVIIDWRSEKSEGSKRLINAVVGVLLIIAIPLLYYRLVYYQTNILNIYWTGLPLFRMDENYFNYYLPYLFLSVYLILLAVLYKENRKGNIKNLLLWSVCQVVQILILIFCTYHFWYKDDNFRKELAMNRCIENLDWEGVLSIARDETDEPTRLMVMYKNLALFRLGRAGNEMYNYLDGAKPSNAPFDVHMMQVGGKMIYMHYGKLNFCYRWCLEDGVEFGWRVDYLRYLVKCSLLNGETKVARKYIEILKHTLYYKDWAEKYESYLRNPSLMKKDPEFIPIFHMLGYRDNLDSDNTLVEMYLLKSFAHDISNDLIYQEQTLISAMQMKDIALFWPRFTQYAILHPHQHMPKHYQEAAFMYGNLEHKVDISHMPFDQDVIQNYKDFMAFAQQCQGMTMEQMKAAFYPRFGNTFFYNYFLVRNLKSY
jgi:hypothetical protein